MTTSRASALRIPGSSVRDRVSKAQGAKRRVTVVTALRWHRGQDERAANARPVSIAGGPADVAAYPRLPRGSASPPFGGFALSSVLLVRDWRGASHLTR